MEERLKNGYTMYFSFDFTGNVEGGYLQQRDWGMDSQSFTGEEEIMISSFPSVMESLQPGNLLQIYSSASGMTTVMLGHTTFDGPYNEGECLEQTVIDYSSTPILALAELNNRLACAKEKPPEFQKVYRLYGSDKYQRYSGKFLGED